MSVFAFPKKGLDKIKMAASQQIPKFIEMTQNDRCILE